MIVTLFTDASFDPERKIGTWAAWAKRDGGTERSSGVFRNPLTGINAAETGGHS